MLEGVIQALDLRCQASGTQTKEDHPCVGLPVAKDELAKGMIVGDKGALLTVRDGQHFRIFRRRDVIEPYGSGVMPETLKVRC